jgi:hypothetical protein
MKIYFNGWFGGFIDKTNPGLHYTFFLELFQKVYNENIEIGNLNDSNLLCEFDMLVNSNSVVNYKKWHHTYLFSGESYLKCNTNNYDCILWGTRNNKNFINIPLFIAYLYTNNFVNRLENINIRKNIPSKSICAIISNSNGFIRNKFLDKLEKVINIDYLGDYKNNKTKLLSPYNSQEFIDFVSDYKFIVTMENSREDTYITEKIINGLISSIIPIYWGSSKVYNYFNSNRILTLLNDNDDLEMDNLINKIMEFNNDNNKWLNIVNQDIFSNKNLERTIDIIARDIRCLFKINNNWNYINRIYCINNPLFEEERFNLLNNMFNSLNIHKDFISFISPTYKHTITDEIYNKNVKKQLFNNLHEHRNLKKSELSLFLNYKTILEDIKKNYKDGLFLIFESDVMIGKEINEFNNFLDFINTKKNEFDLIHIGKYDNRVWNNPNFEGQIGYLERIKYNNGIYIEDITNLNDKFRLSRKYYTRCTDSFIWTYNGIVKFLDYMNNKETNYGISFDYYISHFFEVNNNFKHYWSDKEFFIQASNEGLITSTIQT